jgi:hypothetical protein
MIFRAATEPVGQQDRGNGSLGRHFRLLRSFCRCRVLASVIARKKYANVSKRGLVR